MNNSASLLAAGGTLALNGGGNDVGGSFSAAAGASLIIGGNVSLDGTTVLSGPGSIAFSGTVTQVGASGPALQLPAMLAAAGASSFNAAVSLAATGTTVNTAGFGMTLGNTVSGGGTGGLTKTGAGVLTLSSANSYLGGTTVSGGTLLVTATGALPAGSSLTVGAGGTFIFDPSASSSTVAGAVAISGGSSVLGSTVQTAQATVDVAGGLVSDAATVLVLPLQTIGPAAAAKILTPTRSVSEDTSPAASPSASLTLRVGLDHLEAVVWQLADWIAEIPIERLRIFEPACGHAPFLVSAMRLLRSLEIDLPSGEPMSNFLRERLLGVENDAFALEIARLSLTVADEPNSNGWLGLKHGDMFAGDYLESTARLSTVLLTNPPYEEGKAQDVLDRTLPYLPVGAVFGAVVPATLLFSEKNRPKKLREWLTHNCQLGEVSLFPDGIFTFADQECTVLLGRRLPEGAPTRSMSTRLRRVRESDREDFKQDYRFTTSRIRPQSSFEHAPDFTLWVAEFDEEIWEWIDSFPKLGSMAVLGQGMRTGAGRQSRKRERLRESPFLEAWRATTS